jgi:hypothetical protein
MHFHPVQSSAIWHFHRLNISANDALIPAFEALICTISM